MLLFALTTLAFAGPVERAEKIYQKLEKVDPSDHLRRAEILTRVLDKDPDHRAARLDRVRAYIAVSGDVDGLFAVGIRQMAAKDLEYLANNHPDTVEGAIARQALSDEDDNDVIDVPIPQPECPAEATAAFEAGEQAFRNGDRAGAQQQYAAALEKCPKNSVWWTYAGDSYLPEDTSLALQHYDRALSEEPCNYQASRFRGDVLVKMGAAEPAYDSITLALACHPHYLPAWHQIGVILDHLGGTVRWEGPEPLPTLVTELGDGPDAARWRAWLDHRAEQPVVDVASAVAAVEAGLAVGAGATGRWQLLAEAQRSGDLEHAVLMLMLEPALVPELRRDIDERAAYVRHALLRFPGAP